jgi:hypothetical protein
VVVIAPLAARQLEGAVGDHLVRVHVRRRPGAPLDHVDEEVLVMTSRAELLRGTHDHVAHRTREQTELLVRERGGLLHHGERLDERRELA